MRHTIAAFTLAAAFLTAACTGSPTQPTSGEVTPVARPADPVPLRTGIFINVGGENGTIPCDWDLAPVCGTGRFASCVQHGTGTGQPGPLGRWESSEWQCFPESWMPQPQEAR